MSFNIHTYIVKKWIVLRMAAQEFYFKQPFEIKDEYPIMKSVLFLALFPLELIFIFTYARTHGSLSAYNLPILIIMAVVNLIISNIVINNIKDKPFINEIIDSYNQLDYENRKRLYSFKNGTIVTFLMVILPWSLLFVSIAIVCLLVPH